MIKKLTDIENKIVIAQAERGSIKYGYGSKDTHCGGLVTKSRLPMGFPRQEYWSRLPFPPPGDLPN